jgi:hypothetical protein
MPIYPVRPPKHAPVNGMEALGLYDKSSLSPSRDVVTDKAVSASVNGKFGLVAIGTAG